MRHNAAMTETLSLGEPVVVLSDPGAGTGLVAELRRNDGRVLFPRTGRSLWAPLRDLRRAETASLQGSLEAELAALLSILGCLEMEVSMPEPDRCRLLAAHGAIRPETVDAIRERLGDRLIGYVIRPLGMRRVQTVLEFVTAPRPPA